MPRASRRKRAGIINAATTSYIQRPPLGPLSISTHNLLRARILNQLQYTSSTQGNVPPLGQAGPTAALCTLQASRQQQHEAEKRQQQVQQERVESYTPRSQQRADSRARTERRHGSPTRRRRPRGRLLCEENRIARLAALERRPEEVYEDEDEGFVLTQRPPPPQRTRPVLAIDRQHPRRVRPAGRSREPRVQVEDEHQGLSSEQDELAEGPVLQREPISRHRIPRGGTLHKEGPSSQQDELAEGPILQQEPRLYYGIPRGSILHEEDEALIGVFLDEVEQEELSEGRAVPYIDYYAPSPAYASKWRPAENAAKGVPQSGVDYRHILDRANRVCIHCGALHWIEERKATTTKRNPRFMCCVNGSIQIPQPPTYPNELMLLLSEHVSGSSPTRRTRRCETFHNSIRYYNNAFSFCSLGAQVDQHLAQQLNGAYTFRAHGTLYHRIGGLLPIGDQPPAFAQLYIYDAEEEQSIQRARAFQNLDLAVCLIIQRTLAATNPFVQFFRTNAERIRNSSTVAVSLLIVENVEQDPRVYNRPTAREVAALIPTANDGQYGLRQVVLERKSGQLSYLNEARADYLPLRYPILYPYGETGWCQNFPRVGFAFRPGGHAEFNDDFEQQDSDSDGDVPAQSRGRNGSTRVSQQEWWKYHFQIREPLHPHMLAGRLFHELSVDAFAAISASRLYWLRQNQKQLRIESYSGLVDAVNENDGAVTGVDVGQRIILPATFTGSPRQMREAYLDAIALARRYGSPDFFITFTCNPAWIEIERELYPGQTARDRPDLVARIFNLKVQELLNELMNKHILGHVAVVCYTIEFQKRGLPHMHMLLIMKEQSRVRIAEDVDQFIYAEIPDPYEHPLLHSIVTRLYLHGPCGTRFPNASCMRDGKCRFGFPLPFQSETTIGSNQKPQYRRRNDGVFYRKRAGGFEYRNCDVTAYNPILTLRFNAHINVESCAGYGSVKYVYKYVYKGPDYATVAVGPEGRQVPVRDEIKEFLDARYVASPEAFWRIYAFKTHKKSIPVQKLQIHLPDQQRVAFNADADLEAHVDRDSIRHTTLTRFFEINAQMLTGVTYQDFPERYRWDRRTKQWRLRKRGFAIGRITWLPMSCGEAYYLRILLVSVKDQVSFEDCRTYLGVLYPTFHAACLARGLLQDDAEYKHALEEAAAFQLGKQLREFFATILCSCEPADPSALWVEFKVRLADDCIRDLRAQYGIAEPTQEDAEDLALCYLRVALNRRNRNLTDCSLPEPTRDWLEEFASHRNRLLRDALSYDAEEMQYEVDHSVPLFNTEQRLIYTTLNSAVDIGEGGIFFVDGPGGTGKTFLQNAVLAAQRLKGRPALAVASSGIAATLLAGGCTAHSQFKIPIPCDADSVCNIAKGSHLAELLCETSIIFWDEAVMCHRYAIEAVSRTLQDLRKQDDPRKDKPFGGIVVCFCGDFRQTLPIVKKGTRGQIVAATLKRSPLWQNMHVFRLTQNMRLLRPGIGEEERIQVATFASKLLSVGERTGPDGCITWDTRDQVLGGSIHALLASIFPDIRRSRTGPELDAYADVLRDSALLAPKNDVVNDLNAQLLAAMPEQEKLSYSIDYCKDPATAAAFPREFLQSIDLPSLPPHELRLKVGCPVMLLRNLDPNGGLCNGTRLIVYSISRSVLRCKILGTRNHLKWVQLPRMPLDTPESDGGVSFTRHQFPIKLAFAMTINKAQGQSLYTVGLLLTPEVFAHGQLYVALSRVTRPDGIRMLVPHTLAARSGRIKNVVYSEVF